MKPYNLENETFTHILAKKKTTTTALVSHFGKLGYTKQGVYKVLRKLHKEGKILWLKTTIEIHLLWLHDEIEKLAQALPKREILFKEFTEKKLTYRVKTLTELENVYGQIFISITSSLHDNVKNFLFYDFHNYTYVNTVPVVDWYINFIFKRHGNICLLVGSESSLDLELKKKNKMRAIQIHCIKRKWDLCLSVIGDYVMHVHINKKMMTKINEIFETMTEEEARIPLQKLYEEKSNHKVTIHKSPKQARELEKFFSQYFVLR